MLNKVIINAGGKERLFRFDLYAMEKFTTDTSFKGQFAYIARMLHAGLSSACYAQDKENDFSKEDVLDMIDELALTEEGKEKLALINNCMAESQAFKSLMEAADKTDKADAEKKTLIGIGSELMPLEKSA